VKTIFSLCALILLVGLALVVWKVQGRDDHFGNPFVGSPSAAISEVVGNPEAFLGKQISLHGNLKRQCPATGCWFFLVDPVDSKGRELKVEMGDTTPRLPAGVGRSAHVEGQLIKFGEEYEFIGVAVTFSPQRRSP